MAALLVIGLGGAITSTASETLTDGYNSLRTLEPRQDWAADLLNVAVVAVGLAITWRLLRDHLDKNRALFGLAALVLIPFYDIKSAILNANTVQIPFWAAALLFYLRARRGLGERLCPLDVSVAAAAGERDRAIARS